VKASIQCGDRAWNIFTAVMGNPTSGPGTSQADLSLWTQVYITRGLILFGNDQVIVTLHGLLAAPEPCC
jgi:hypothetical protein